jgi:HD-GYP domain-containing protein (c-di-GMP phosphodiesterase class II)
VARAAHALPDEKVMTLAVPLTPAVETYDGLFHPAPVATLQPNSGCHFALYLALPWRTGQRYLLFKAAHIDLTEKKRRELLENGVKTLYVRDDEAGDYFEYVDNTVGQVLVSDTYSPQEKSHVLYETSHALVQSTFEKPESPAVMAANQKVVTHTVTALVNEPRMLRTMVALFAYDYSLYTHSVHVSVLGTGLLLDMNHRTPDNLRNLALGFLMHDIGKSRVAPTIVRKAGMLTPWESKQMEQHPEFGVDLMQPHAMMTPEALDIIMAHHEHLDGSGYPRHLEAAALSDAVKICSVVDIYDALTSHRVYKPALRAFDAIRLIRDKMAAQIDDEILQLLIYKLGPNARTRV